MTAALTCVVADDHPAVLATVCSALEKEGIEVVARVGDGPRALAEIEERRPAVALLDVRMPRLTGLEVARRIDGGDTGVVIYTAYGDPALAVEALDAGARGFVLKEAPLENLVRAIRLVADGFTYIDAALVGGLAKAYALDGYPELTKRERDILRLLASGLRNEEIGSHLFMSPFTVRNHVDKVLKKLGANSRTHAVAIALRSALIT